MNLPRVHAYHSVHLRRARIPAPGLYWGYQMSEPADTCASMQIIQCNTEYVHTVHPLSLHANNTSVHPRDRFVYAALACNGVCVMWSSTASSREKRPMWTVLSKINSDGRAAASDYAEVARSDTGSNCSPIPTTGHVPRAARQRRRSRCQAHVRGASLAPCAGRALVVAVRAARRSLLHAGLATGSHGPAALLA